MWRAAVSTVAEQAVAGSVASAAGVPGRALPAVGLLSAAAATRWRAAALASLLPLALLLLWWQGTAQGWISAQTLPTPRQVVESFVELLRSGELQHHVGISLQRVALGFLAGASVGLVLGLGMGLSRPVHALLHPSFRALAHVPMLGWLPLLMLLLGIGEALKVVLIAKAALIPVTLNTLAGVRGVPRAYREVAEVLRFSRAQLLLKVVLPAAFPQIWSGLRFGLTKSWLLLVVVELLASSEGLGFLTVSGQQLFQLELVLVAVFVIGLVGYLLDRGLEQVEHRLLRWRRSAFAA